MPRKFRITLTTQILIGLVLGVILGFFIHRLDSSPERKAEIISWINVVSRVFLSLIKVIIAPLIFSTIVVGMAGAGSFKEIGRVGLKTIVYFEIVTTIALFIGLGAANLTRPGAGVNLPPEPSIEAREIASRAAKFSPQDQIVNIFPQSIVTAMYENNVLQIVIFSLLFAISVSALGERGRPLFNFAESLSEVMFRFTNYIMLFAPYGVGAAMAVAVGSKGLGVLGNLAMIALTLYGALVVFIILVLGAVAIMIHLPILSFIRLVKEPVLLAFTTTSSESAFPKALENMERLGVPRRIVSFVLPMGYSFNLAGSTLYLPLAALFVAQASNHQLSLGQQLLMVLTLMLTTKGIAVVPRASLVVLSGTLATFGLPLEGIAVILGVDALMDMARTATNVLGNCLATVVVARWEGEFRDPGRGIVEPLNARLIDQVHVARQVAEQMEAK
jgi:proton glutamate symport protein